MPKDASPNKNKQTSLGEWLSTPGGKDPKAPRRDTFGWNTGITDDIMLRQELIEEQYGLNWTQLKGVKCEETIHRGIKGRRYYEKAVEWRAWEIHDGPVGLWNYLKNRLKEQGEATFHPPFDYRSGKIYDIYLDNPPTLPDRYCHGSSILASCKSRLPAWTWGKCNDALDDALSQSKFEFTLEGEREQAMLRAIDFVCAYPEYAARPADPTEETPRVQALLATLRCAVPPPPDPEDWDVVLQPASHTLDVRADRFDWSAKYLEEVFAALLEAIEEHGAETEYWKTIRWMVYDKYASIFARGLRYDRLSKTWSDGAREWLRGRMHEDALRGSLRGLCESGRRYNELLPDPRASAPPSSASPAPIAVPWAASSSTAVAGPSSAPY